MVITYGSGANIGFGHEKVTSPTDDWGVPVGTRATTPDGRVFRYSFSDGALGAGQVLASAAAVANHDMDLAIAANAAIGAKSIQVTLGATAAVVDLYKHGFIYINDGAGEGYLYHIQGHAAVASAGTLTAILGDDEVREALTTATSLAGLIKNLWQDVIPYDGASLVGTVAGVAPTEVADNEFFWAQTWGPAAVLASAVVPVLGQPVSPDGSVVGAVQVASASTIPSIGIAIGIPAVAGDSQLVDLMIKP